MTASASTDQPILMIATIVILFVAMGFEISKFVRRRRERLALEAERDAYLRKPLRPLRVTSGPCWGFRYRVEVAGVPVSVTYVEYAAADSTPGISASAPKPSRLTLHAAIWPDRTLLHAKITTLWRAIVEATVAPKDKRAVDVIPLIVAVHLVDRDDAIVRSFKFSVQGMHTPGLTALDSMTETAATEVVGLDVVPLGELNAAYLRTARISKFSDDMKIPGVDNTAPAEGLVRIVKGGAPS